VEQMHKARSEMKWKC